MTEQVRVAVIGGGPAGAQCALWLTKFGISTVLIEKGVLGGLQARSPYTNSWLSVVQATTMAKDVAQNIAQNLTVQGCRVLASTVENISKSGAKFRIDMSESALIADFVVLATGTQEKKEEGICDQRQLVGLIEIANYNPSDDIVAILGGGDAACEAFHDINATAARVHVFARSVRARSDLWNSVPEQHKTAGIYTVEKSVISTDDMQFRFDTAAVCYGWEPVVPQCEFRLSLDERGYIAVSQDMETSVSGVFAIGDVNQRPYPCVSTAISDGVYAAKTIESRIV